MASVLRVFGIDHDYAAEDRESRIVTTTMQYQHN